MKYKHIIALMFFCQTCFGQQVEKASSIAPEDIGAYKWILSGTAQENQVVIFRMATVREWNNKETTEIYDTVCYSPGKKETGTAFFMDSAYFDGVGIDEPKWNFTVLGSTGSIHGKFAGASHSDDKAEITFESKKWGKTTKTFEVLIKSYTEALELYEDLPKLSSNSGWKWSGEPKKKSQ